MKITPEIKKFIEDNTTLSCRALSGQIDKQFGVQVSYKAVSVALDKARSDKAAANSAKVDAVREKILDDADKWANKYLRYLDEEVEALKKILDNSKDIPIETARDRAAISQTFQKSLCTVLDFVKPEEKTQINIDIDLSKFSEEELEQYGKLAAKLEGIPAGKG